MQTIKLSDSSAIRNLKRSYQKKKPAIQKRLKEFRHFYDNPVAWYFENNQMQLRPISKNHDERIFEELCFCILTANTSAEMGMKSVDTIRHLLLKVSMEEMKESLEGIYRFKTLRPQYIIHTRNYLQKEHDFRLKKVIENMKRDPQQLRDFFADNEGVKGLGYKEASHFLRNIGFSGYAILDKHVLLSLLDFKVIDLVKLPLNSQTYKETEKKMILFSNEIGIPMDELDLLLWSNKTGKILK